MAILLLGTCATRTGEHPELRQGYRQPAMGDISPAGTATSSILIGDEGLVGGADPEVGRRGRRKAFGDLFEENL